MVRRDDDDDDDDDTPRRRSVEHKSDDDDDDEEEEEKEYFSASSSDRLSRFRCIRAAVACATATTNPIDVVKVRSARNNNVAGTWKTVALAFRERGAMFYVGLICPDASDDVRRGYG